MSDLSDFTSKNSKFSGTKGLKISLRDIAFKRSVKKIKKIQPKDYKQIIGKISKVDINPDDILSKSFFTK